MYDNRTSRAFVGIRRFHSRYLQRSTWNYHWWILGLVSLFLGTQIEAQYAWTHTYNSPHTDQTIRGYLGRRVNVMRQSTSSTITVSFNGAAYIAWTPDVAGLPTAAQANRSPVSWSGFPAVSSAVGTGQSVTNTIAIKYNGKDFGPFTYQVPAATVNVTYVTNFTGSRYLDFATPFIIQVNLDGTYTIDDPYPVGPGDAYAHLEGKNVAVPYYVAAGVESVEVVIGGQTYSFPVEIQEGDSGGVAMLDIPIPQDWDGMATINGQAVNIAPRVAYTGDPTMEYYANPYVGRDPATLPEGVTWGVLQLPAGVTVGNSLPLPTGITNLYVPPVGMVDNRLPVGVTDNTGVTTYTTTGPITSGTNITIINNGTVVGSGSTGNDQEDRAIVDSLLPEVQEGVKPSAGFSGLADQWDTLKISIQNKFGTFAPLQTGSLPRASTLDFSFPAPAMLGGSRNISIDLEQNPFPIARALALVLVTFHAGFFFIKYIKV